MRLVAGLLLLPVWTLCAQTEPAKPPQENVIVLEPGKRVDRVMTTRDNHTLKVHVNVGEYLRVVIEQSGISVIATVLDPDGAKVVVVDSPAGAYGPEYVSLVAEKQGDYLLQLRTTIGRTNTGRYSASIEALRIATPEDKENSVAEKTFAVARQLLQQSSNGAEPDPKKRREEALAKFEEVRAYWTRKKSVRWEAIALHSLGITRRRLSQPKEAAQYFREALELAPQLEARDWRLVATFWNDSGLNYTDLSEYSLAIESLKRALQIFREHQDKRGEASASINTAIAFYNLDRFRDGLSYLERALELRAEEKDLVSQVNILQQMGDGYHNLGEPGRAVEYFDRAIDIYKSMTKAEQDRAEIVFAGLLNNRALDYQTSGQWKLAIENYEQALKSFQKFDRTKAVRTQINLGRLYYELGDYSLALTKLELALKDTQESGDRTMKAEVLLNLGEVKARQGETNIALNYFMSARDIGSTDGVQAGALRNIGRMKMQLGDPHKALDSYNEALNLYRKIESIEGEALTLQQRGEVYLALGEKTGARDDFTQALKYANALATPQGRIDALYGLARVEREMNDVSAALAHSKEALELIESQRANVPGQQLRTSYFSTQVGHYELFIDLMMRQYRNTNSDSNLAAALEASERARARDLVDFLNEAQVDIRKEVDPVLLKQQDEIQQRLNAKAQVQMRLLSDKQTEAAKTIEKEIADLLDDYDKLKTKIRESSPAYSKLTQPQSLSVSEIQQLFDDDTLLLEYFLGEERSYLWLVGRNSITAVDSLPKRSEIEASGKRFYQALTEGRGLDVRSSHRQTNDAAPPVKSDPIALSQMLLGPVADKIGKKRLVIVGDGVLQYLPFAALPVPTPTGAPRQSVTRSAGASYLIQEHEIVYLPSASVLSVVRSETAGRKPAPLSVAVLADPVFNSNDERLKVAQQNAGQSVQTIAQKESIPKAGKARVFRSGDLQYLPATKMEADAIEAAIPPPGRVEKATGFDASRATVMRLQTERNQIVHFAAHSDLNEEHPELSHIVLSLFDSTGKKQDGYLRLHDIYNLKLPVDLVVLSACNTALGQVIRGEGLIGLTRGFMHAGSPRIIASLWRVEDLGTLELMKHFYHHLAQEGMAPPAALRQAQLDMLRIKRWRTPYDWAGFVLQGEWKPIR